MRSLAAALLTMLSIAPAALREDVTIRYKMETTGSMATLANMNDAITVIRMKGTKGVTSRQGITTIADFTKLQITIVDTARKKFATIQAAECGSRMDR